MKKILYPIIVLVLILLTIAASFNTCHLNNSHLWNISNSQQKNKPIILIHDISPAYFDELKEIIPIIDKYNYSNNTILFVIPDLENPSSGGKWDLRKNKEFVNYLHQLENRGYKVELHGYKHTYHEFNCSKSVCSKKLYNAEIIMSKCGFDNMTLFLPPAWALSNDSMKVLLKHNYTIILTDKLIYPNGTIEKITNNEYTWYIPKNEIKFQEIKALFDYDNSQYQFYLSLHPKPACYGGGTVFLDYFLNKTR